MCLIVLWVECIVVEVVEFIFWEVKFILIEVVFRLDVFIVEFIGIYKVWINLLS